MNESPTEHSTIVTAVVETMTLTDEMGQPYTAFTRDQQLYSILVDIKWAFMPGSSILKLSIF